MGPTGQFVVDRVIDMADEAGDSQQTMLMETDQEPSAKALVFDIANEREDGMAVVEGSPVRSSGSRVVDRAAQWSSIVSMSANM